MRDRVWPDTAPPQLVVLSGAGISAESGLKTFRDGGGLWEGHDIHEVCDFTTWRRNFAAVHRFYNERRSALATAEPNPAHQAVARWQSWWPTHILTQNVDDLFERGGCRDVTHLHGRLTGMMCLACEHDWEIGLTAWRAGEDACPMCKSTSDVKPAIVFFHERAPAYVDLYQTLDSLRPSDVLLVIGTSGYVLPVGEFARWTPGFSVLNNLEPSEHIEESCFDHVLYQPASTAVPDIEAILQRRL